MPIQPDRIRRDIQAIAACTATPGEGASRPTFSHAWREAVDYVMAELHRCGCTTRIDPAGNLHARPSGLSWETPAWLCGSHLDSVPNGGDYDGVTGVVVALELLRAGHDAAHGDFPLELVIFAEEEGTTFGLGMIGSRAYTNELSDRDLGRLLNGGGETYVEAGAPHGVQPEHIGPGGLRAEAVRGFVEVHPEQGPRLWEHDRSVAVVTGIAGRRQYSITVNGRANHAGSTAMTDRQDALAGAADVIIQLEALAPELSPQTVITVGRLSCHPNAVNVIPGKVTFTIDFRSPDDRVLEDGDRRISATILDTMRRRGLQADVQTTESLPAQPLDAALCDRLRRAADRCGRGPLPETTSGALHDAAILARRVPTAMLFVASRDGISHNPAEFSRIEDIAAAAEILWTMIRGSEHRTVSLPELNRLDKEAFVEIIGPIFEQSPWIAERTYARKPFESLGALHDALTATVQSADPEDQLRLIKAHPDLVGLAAQAGTLTPESTREQAAAGLNALSPDDVAQFEAYNKAYHERFGIPFVICARENKKESILAAFPERLAHTRDEEIAAALHEISKIALFRLKDTVTER